MPAGLLFAPAARARFHAPLREDGAISCFPEMAKRVYSSPLGKELAQLPGIQQCVNALCDFEFYGQLGRRCNGWALGEDHFAFPNPSVVIHGDIRMDNAFFDDKAGTCRLVDWQVCVCLCVYDGATLGVLSCASKRLPRCDYGHEA